VKKSRYCLLLPVLHFSLTVALALSIHHANCLNVWTCTGDYGFWMTVSLYGSHLINLSKWLVPALFFICIYRKNQFSAGTFATTAVVTLLIFFSTDVLRHHIIEFLERDWNPTLELGA